LALIDYINGKPVPKRIVTPGFLVDKDSIDRYLDRINK